MTVKKRKQKDKEEDGDHDLLELKLSKRDPWTIKNKLTKSDLNNLSRLLLPSDQVEKHVLHSERGFEFSVKDVDQGTNHLLSFRRVRAKKDVIGMLLDNFGTRGFYFSVLERAGVPVYHSNRPKVPLVAATPPDPCLCKFVGKHLQLRQPFPPEP
ncbi:hypothetical protein NE237_008576 [Protea cynaroides]|uniref:Uncharacterized protein n=1 Tax=Protea cynaroides TaxID=273540 RepID=A0A9Q0KWZ9_9MAGN|nr:hypothetical protein NE237_008576 [Protea cynaroides]